MKVKGVILVSGGVDSLTSFLMLRKKGRVDSVLLYVDLGHRYVKEETECINKLYCDMLRKLVYYEYLRSIGKFEKSSAEIPFRNAMLIMVAAMYGTDIYVSIEQGTSVNDAKDRTVSFLEDTMKYLNSQSVKSYRIYNLVGEMTKQDEMAWVIKNYGRKGRELLKATFSCYNPINGKMCGRCNACIRWYLAGMGVGLERNDWVSDPLTSVTLQEYADKVKENKYGGSRGMQYRKTLKKLGFTVNHIKPLPLIR